MDIALRSMFLVFAGFLLVIPNTLAAVPPTLIISNGTFSMNTTGLIVYYRFEQSNGSAATNDSSGYGNIGTLTNMNLTGNATSGPTLNGKFGNALVFDGVNDYVVTPITSLNTWYLSQSVTFMAWINVSAFNGNPYGGGRFISKGGGRTSLEMGPAGPQIDFSVSNNTANARPQIDKTGFTGKWIHVAGTYNGSLASLYINGTLVDSRVLYGPIADVGDAIAVGADNGGNVGSNATIDEAMIWNRSLTADEIRMLYNNQMTYGQYIQFANSTNTSLSLNYYSNQTLLGSGNVWNGTLGVGYQYLLVNTSGDTKYTLREFLLPLNITQTVLSGNLYVNNTQSSQTWTYPNVTNATATIGARINNEGTFYLLMNNSIVGINGVNFKMNESLLAASVYNFTAAWVGQAAPNYTFTNITYSLTINRGAPILSAGFDRSSPQPYLTFMTFYGNTSSQGDQSLNSIIWQNGTNILNGAGNKTYRSFLGPGIWQFNMTTAQTQNYTGSSLNNTIMSINGNVTTNIINYISSRRNKLQNPPICFYGI